MPWSSPAARSPLLRGLLLLWLRVAKAGERPLLVVAALIGWLYALVAGGSAPVLRAAAGFTLFIGAKFLYRTPRLLNLLAAVAIAFLAVAPDELFDASFQLTFLSVAAMGAIDEPLNSRWLRPWREALGSLSRPELVPKLEPRVAAIRTEVGLIAETISAVLRCRLSWVTWILRKAGGAALFCLQLMLLSACVQWMLAMPMILYFHRLSISGLTANVIIVPLVSLAIPFGFAAIATGWQFFATIALWMLKASQWARDNPRPLGAQLARAGPATRRARALPRSADLFLRRVAQAVALGTAERRGPRWQFSLWSPSIRFRLQFDGGPWRSP